MNYEEPSVPEVNTLLCNTWVCCELHFAPEPG